MILTELEGTVTATECYSSCYFFSLFSLLLVSIRL